VELRHLRYFLAVAEERHFGRAAARMRVAQPPLSRQIQALEADLGFRLFDRSRRHVELTAAGAALLEHTGRIFEAVELARSEAQRASRGESGRIVVGYPSSFAHNGLPELLRSFRARAPAVEIALRELAPQLQVEALREGRIDVGFVRALQDEPGLSFELVRSEPLVVALPKGHALARRKKMPLELLAREPFVLFPRSRAPAYFDQLVSLCRAAGFTPRIVQEAPHLDIVSLVSAGLGVSILPASVRNFRRAGIVLRPLEGEPRTDLLVLWSRRRSSPVLREFLDVVRKHAAAWARQAS
jgi:DNA-binding transcriptional LysR family regulator